ncbi:ribosomal protein L20A (L18A) [Aciduliprofundum sp. MAR08-339]|uniref:50S ribosomal protein L18Ae n=1 Tax=Aciduliprofundum sp. (strain MAR08-339) TaxID=673860 RepID=UPI0002A48CD3|nr:ribosomal protein L20A (L18A) [Aciduliprofundum sp. MAR08-339]
MKVYRVAGLYSPKGKKWFKFTKDVVAYEEEAAKEKIYSIVGSKYGIKRRLIDIKEIKEINPEESHDPMVRYLMRDENE